jgi:hypothetical protein
MLKDTGEVLMDAADLIKRLRRKAIGEDNTVTASLLAQAAEALETTTRALSLAESVYRQNFVAPGEPSSILNALQAALEASPHETIDGVEALNCALNRPSWQKFCLDPFNKTRAHQWNTVTQCVRCGSIRDGQERPVVAVAGRMERTLAEFEGACLVHLDDEQRRATPDNALIALLCDAVRLKREHVELASLRQIASTSQSDEMELRAEIAREVMQGLSECLGNIDEEFAEQDDNDATVRETTAAIRRWIHRLDAALTNAQRLARAAVDPSAQLPGTPPTRD